MNKKLPFWVKVLGGAVIAILVIGISVFAFVQTKLNKINRVKVDDVQMVDSSEETFEIDETILENIDENTEVIDAEEITWDDVDVNVMSDTDVSNILLIGQDRRIDEDRQRSDTMIICSINKKTNKIILSSVMRDLYVPIPGYSDNRINAAYKFGGMPLLDQVIEESLGIRIDGNVEVDFDGFINSLAVIGNLDIELNEAEANYLNKCADWGTQETINADDWNLVAGVNSLSPEQALAYARTRYVGNSDWERTDRQRRVLMAAFDKIKGSDLATIMDLADDILPNLTTDMTNMEILGYVYTVFTNDMTGVESYRIPVEKTYSCQTLSRGMEVLVPNLTENSRYLQTYIYGEAATE